MQLTSAQLTTLKSSISATATQISVNGVNVAINAIPNTGDGNDAIAAWYNLTAGTPFWVWRTSVSRSDVYTTVSDLASPTVWNWTTYKGQSVVEQGAWTQMFMGDACNFANLNNRSGVNAIFGAAGTQRDHVFSIARRLATNVEKLFASAVVSVGGIAVVAAVGNVLTDALGSTTNPAITAVSGLLSAQDVNTARNLP